LAGRSGKGSARQIGERLAHGVAVFFTGRCELEIALPCAHGIGPCVRVPASELRRGKPEIFRHVPRWWPRPFRRRVCERIASLNIRFTGILARERTIEKPDAAPVPIIGGVEMGGDFEVDPNTRAAKSPPPASTTAPMPADMTTVSAAAKVMRMTPAAFIRWARAQGLTLIPVPRGTRGGPRLSEGALLAAMDRSARATMDAMRSPVLDAALEDPNFTLPK